MVCGKSGFENFLAEYLHSTVQCSYLAARLVTMDLGCVQDDPLHDDDVLFTRP